MLYHLFLLFALDCCISVSNGMKVTNRKQQRVAIIGGGMAGLSCGQALGESQDFDVTVYDTGRLRPGGRCSSREPGDPIKDNDDDESKCYPLLSQFRYDHAAQLIALSNDQNQFPEFQTQLETWKEQGLVRKLPPKSVWKVSKNGKAIPIDGQSFYHGTDGMGSLPVSMVKQAANFRLEQDVWVSPSSGVRYQKSNGGWKLQANGKTLGFYDRLIIAHNGKCADRIMSKTPAKDVHWLLRVNFSPTVPAHGGKKMTLNSLYSLTVVLKSDSAWSKALPNDFVCGFMEHPKLRMITCQTRKYPNYDNSDYEVWNILSSAKFAKNYKAPQEFLPDDVVEQVTDLLVQAVNESLNIQGEQIKLLESRVQLWGAAVPLNVWNNGQGFLYDSDHNVAVAGDWLLEPSIAGAWTSGYRLANHLKKNPINAETIGLKGQFERSEAVNKLGIASLPQQQEQKQEQPQ